MRKEILILSGISGSGKSTFANQMLKEYPNKILVINRDNIRNYLFGYDNKTVNSHYELPTKEFNKREKSVSNFANLQIRDAILGKNEIELIIIDNTNLKEKYIKEYEYYNIPIKIKTFDIGLETAIERDLKRDRIVGSDVIKRQYNQYQNVKKFIENYNFKPREKYKPNENLPDVVIFDIDGTLAHSEHRDIFDLSQVINDELDSAVGTLIHSIDRMRKQNGAMLQIFILSGRSDDARKETENWLAKHHIPYDKLFMRKHGDYRKDWIVKNEFWDEISKTRNILAMIDDRSQVVDRARYLGYKVLQVDYGNF